MHDVGTHSSLPTSAIIALGLLEKKEKEEDKQFYMGGKKCILEYLAIHKYNYFSSSKGFYQCGYYCKEHLYTQNRLKI